MDALLVIPLANYNNFGMVLLRIYSAICVQKFAFNASLFDGNFLLHKQNGAMFLPAV